MVQKLLFIDVIDFVSDEHLHHTLTDGATVAVSAEQLYIVV